MPTPALSIEERARRKALVEATLQEGFSPIGIAGGKGSSVEEACRRDGRISGFFARWVRDEESAKARGEAHFIPDWSLYRPEPRTILPVERVTEVSEETTPSDHARMRAYHLREWMDAMITGTRYPVVNPEALIIEPRIDLKYSRKEGEYVEVERAPRAWVSAPLMVEKIQDPRGRTFIFTSAQNDAEIHEAFWSNLKAYAEHTGAQIVVGAFTYETAWFNESHATARSYDPRIADYIAFGQLHIGDSFLFAGEANVLPTASRPISDLVTYSRGKWAVFPHTKLQLKSVPSTDPRVQAHQVMTTGAVTKPKVIPRKAGIKSIFHHIFGAVIVEFDDHGRIFPRQINASDDGSFYDLDRFVENGRVTTGHRIDGLVVGDLHLRKIDPSNSAATFGFDPQGRVSFYTDNMIDVLRPKLLVFHDIFDNETRNHHHVGDSAYAYAMAMRGRDKVEDEINDVGRFLKDIRRHDHRVLVVESNHDIGLDRYVKEGRYRGDGPNILLGLDLERTYIAEKAKQSVIADLGGDPKPFSLLETAIRQRFDGLDHVEWAYDGHSYVMHNIEIGHHGFRGANGAKGTITGFARMGRKMIIGDKHTPEIMDGVYCVGCMKLQQRYNIGPSSWSITHCIIYKNGKRSLVTLQDGKWRAEKPRVIVRASTSNGQKTEYATA